MAGYIETIQLEFSEDPLSDTTPTWTDVTSYLQSIEWWSGVDREGGEPQPGGATIRLRNTNRDWEPDYQAGRFYPNVTTGRRLRLSVDGSLGDFWYIQNIDIDYPSGLAYSEVTLTCGDGFEVLALDDLPGLDPPSASTYSDVVSFDEPWGYWRLGEPEGTKSRVHLSTTLFWLGKKIRRKWFKIPRGRDYSTSAEAGGTAGPAGVYKNTPLLGSEGLILGDRDTAVEFRSPQSEYMRAALDEESFKHNAVSFECWVKPTVILGDQRYLAGPFHTASSGPTFSLQRDSATGDAIARVRLAGGTLAVVGTTNIDVGSTYHLCGVWDGQTLRLYVNGVEEFGLNSNPTGDGALVAGDANQYVYVGQNSNGGEFADAVIDEPAVYERALSADRVAAHYTAGSARGWPQQTAGERIADIVDNPLWNNGFVQTSGFEVIPQFKAGQAQLEEISELANSEGVRTMFFFATEDPVYLGWDWQGTDALYNTTQVVFGDVDGETRYENVELVYDNEIFNEVVSSHEAGEEVLVVDTDSQDERGRRVHAELTDVLTMEHMDVEAIANEALDLYRVPALRPVSITVNGKKAYATIDALKIGHQVRVRRRGAGGTPIDRVCNILGYRMSLTPDTHLVATYTLSRGFNAALDEWHLGIDEYSELGETAVLG